MFVQFSILAGSRPQLVGAQVDGGIYERIRRPQFGSDSGWVGASANFMLTDVIEDTKTVGYDNPEFAGANIGDVFDDFYQQNRIVIQNGCGDDQNFNFTERHFQRVKVTAFTWKLIEIS